jgi:hypothetical protein
MMRVERRAVPLFLLAGVVIFGMTALAIQQRVGARLQYFPESGHLVRDPFLRDFQQRGGVSMFGYPLTDAYVDQNGTLVQTFERAKFQLTVRGVELAPIGRDLRLGDPLPGLKVDPALKDFYASQGGEAYFGLPLDAARQENGLLLVQDFERVRIVHEDYGSVHLANLGSAYLSAFPPPRTDGQAAIRLRGTPTPPPQIHASISVEHPAIPQGGEQTLYVYVEDSEGHPVAGAKSLAVLRYDQARAEVEMPDTDANGLAAARFEAPPALPGSQVVVELHLLSGEIFLTVETNYFQWW